MEISETKIRLVGKRNDRLKAFCSITFDNAFVVRDLKIIEGTSGYFVAMPSRKLTDHCSSCGAKNHLRTRFCCECGVRLDENRGLKRNNAGRTKLHADIAHPINSRCREMIQSRIIDAYHHELERSQQPGYKPPSLDFEDDDVYSHEFEPTSPPTPAAEPHAPPPPAPPPQQPSVHDPPEQKKDDHSDFSEGIL